MSFSERQRPFKHWVDDQFLTPAALHTVNLAWPESGWTQERNKYCYKRHQGAHGPVFAAFLNRLGDSEFVGQVEALTGISGLFIDDEQFGSGLHCIPPGGFLRMHTDFQVHPKGHRRRLNLLIYCSMRWDEAWGGDLRLGANQQTSYFPTPGRAVLFETTRHTWHGHPEPTMAPIERRSIAVYYYTAADGGIHDKTIYRS